MSQDPLVGTVLGGARLLQRVSKGLMAHVYQGHYERLGIPVAVKVLSPKATSQGVNRERFVREGRALAQLSHPNIIKIYNVGHENGRFFIIMDWIQDGMNLRQLAQTRPLTPAQSLKVVQRLCEALEYIHQRGLVHRDIKPANVCLRRGGHPVLMDFSLIKDSKSDVQLTAPGTIMGTVNFMPPEQAQPGGPFGDVSPRSDVYSLGGAAYWLLTGKPPFKGRTPMETIIKLMREAPQPLSAHNPSLPKVIDDVILGALAKKPQDRPGSARELAERIEYVFQNHRAELDAAQRPDLAANEDGSPATPVADESGRAAAASSEGQRWGSGSSSSEQAAVPAQAPAAASPLAASPLAASPLAASPLAASPLGAPAPGFAQPAAQAGFGAPVAGPPGFGQPGPAAVATATATASPPHGADGDIDQDDDDDDDDAGGGVFVPSMSTEGAAAGMLRLPDELREDHRAPSSQGGGGKVGYALLLGGLVLVITAGVAVAVAVFAFDWKPF